MKVFSRQQIFQIINTERTVNHLSYNDLLLSCALALFEKIKDKSDNSVLIVCSNTSSGDIGVVLANLLAQKTVKEVTLAHFYWDSCQLKGLINDTEIKVVSSLREIKQSISEKHLIIDCMYSIELKENVFYPFDLFIDWINDSGNYVISADLPSGIDCDNGSILFKAVKADETIGLQLAKPAYYLYPASSLCGKISYGSVSLSYDSISTIKPLAKVYDFDDVKQLLPPRVSHSHKGDYGKILLIGGSDNYTGAAVLAAKAILKSGGGLLTVMSYNEVIDVIKLALPEAMTVRIENNLIYQLETFDFDRFDLIVIGPGLSRNRNTEVLLQYVLKTDKDVLIDADGLFYLKNNLNLLMNRRKKTVITPHLGEYQRIFPYNSKTILKDLADLTHIYQSLIIVLKSEKTIIVTQDRLVFNDVGNNALAKGGSGDVLAGVISGLFASNGQFDSVVAGVYLHSLAADYWVKQHSSYSLLASDLIEYVDKVLAEMEGKN
ncbi:MAG: NAD(P)H-hydrate dehydratase [Erysipelotrichaceae bacterium]